MCGMAQQFVMTVKLLCNFLVCMCVTTDQAVCLVFFALITLCIWCHIMFTDHNVSGCGVFLLIIS